MSAIPSKRHTLTVLIALAVSYASPTIGASVSVTPARASNFYSGVITVQITGLATGETVRIERFIDFNTNDIVNNAIDLMVQSFLVTDNKASTIGGATNANVIFDSNPANGAITATLDFRKIDIDHTAGRFIFRVSSPSGSFSSSNALFRITNSILGQTSRGLVRNSGTNVGYSIVAALTESQNDTRLVASAVVSSNGQYNVSAPAGTYRMVAVKRGYVCNFDTAPLVTLTNGATPSNNIPLMVATRSISGRLVNAANTNVGLPGVNLFLNSDTLFTLAFTDTNGNFNVPVTATQWKVDPDEDALRTLGYLALRDPPSADTSTGNVTGLVIAVPRATALICGTLKNSLNSPLPGLELFASSSNRVYSTRSITDPAGAFILAVAAGDWDVSVDTQALSALGYVADSIPRFSLAQDEVVKHDVSVTRITAFIAGRLIDETGATLTNMEIRANDNSGHYSSATANSNGKFAIGVLDGTWYLRLEYNESAPRSFIYPNMSITISNGISVSNIVYQVLTATNTVSITLRDYTGSVVSGLDVYANTTINGQPYSASRADRLGDGTYQLTLAGGTWQVGVECYGAMDLGYNCPNMKIIDVPAANSLDFRVLPYPGPTTIDSLSRLPNGQIRFQINGTQGYDYQIETSPDLFSWSALLTTNSASPPFQFSDGVSNQVRRFYRASRMTPSD